MGEQSLKIAIFSDIHGNDIAFEAAVNDAKARGAGLFIIAGDLVSDYPLSSQVIHRSKELTPYVVKGNRESYFERYYTADDKHWKEYKQFSALLWSIQHMTSADFTYISSLPEQTVVPLEDGASILATHFIEDIDSYMPAMAEKILVCGHTHTPCIKWVGDKLFINPGSVGVNISNGFNAEYLMLDYTTNDITTQMILVPYDEGLLRDTLSQSDILDDENAKYWFTLLLKTQEDGIGYIREFFITSEKLKAEAGYTCYDTPNDIWDKIIEQYKEKGVL
jgi:putative phosphoesterase